MWGMKKLRDLRAAGEEVALILADQWMPDITGDEFLARASQLFPTAKRAVLVEGNFDVITLQLDENVFAGEMDAAYRVASNANAAPLWITLDKEIGEDSEALDVMAVEA